MPFKSEMVFEDKMAEIANHVFNLYLLSFQPKDLQPGQHSLKVGLRFSSDSKIYARRGYWAAEQGQASTAGPLQGQTGNVP